jgi:hypothetical protein
VRLAQGDVRATLWHVFRTSRACCTCAAPATCTLCSLLSAGVVLVLVLLVVSSVRTSCLVSRTHRSESLLRQVDVPVDAQAGCGRVAAPLKVATGLPWELRQTAAALI